MKKWILILIMGLSKGQIPGSDMDARFLTDEEREERQENPPDGLGRSLNVISLFIWSKMPIDLPFTSSILVQ